MDHLNTTSLGLEAIQKISRLGGGENETFHGDPSEFIDLTVDAVLRLPLDRTTIRHLAKNGPGIIRGCIRLMKAVKPRHSGEALLFSFEYCYNCFRLLVTTLNIWLLERWGELEATLAVYGSISGVDMHEVLPIIVTGLVRNQLHSLQSGDYSDTLLGWSSSTDHQRRESQLAPADLSELLCLVWDDRKYFLQALLSNPTSGLSGMLFLFLRYVFKQRGYAKGKDWELLNIKLNELCLRYLLAADKSDFSAVLGIIDAIANSNDSSVKFWNADPKHVDAQDSRCILQAFIGVLSKHTPGTFLTRVPFTVLRLVNLSIHPHSQDLLPEALRLTIEYGWTALVKRTEEGNAVLISFGFFGCLWAMIESPHKHPYRLTQTTRAQIMDAVCRADLLDFIARVIVQLSPGEHKSSPKATENASTLSGISLFLNILVNIVPKRELTSYCEVYVLEWRKIAQFLRIKACDETTVCLEPEVYRDHYEQTDSNPPGLSQQEMFMELLRRPLPDNRMEVDFDSGAPSGMQRKVDLQGAVLVLLIIVNILRYKRNLIQPNETALQNHAKLGTVSP
ncbi:unnamed protein product [Rhizoctonia solani]|nr:unnamed protein product [Rhizoctonia solani]